MAGLIMHPGCILREKQGITRQYLHLHHRRKHQEKGDDGENMYPVQGFDRGDDL